MDSTKGHFYHTDPQYSIIFGLGKMVQWIKYLASRRTEVQILKTHIKLDVVVHICNPSMLWLDQRWGRESTEAHRSASLAYAAEKLRRNPASTKVESEGRHLILSSHLHMCTQAHIHEHAHMLNTVF